MKETKERIQFLIDQLALSTHPEGGFFKEIYRSQGVLDDHCLHQEYMGSRNYATSIYFLLTSESFSAFHKIHQDEIWHFYEGSPLELHIISPDGVHQKHLIGSHLSQGQVYQLVVPGNHWFASKVMEQNSYSLVGCSVSPGFDFQDFTLAKRDELIKLYPHHQNLITDFTN